MMKKFGKSVVEGEVYKMAFFGVLRNTRSYRATKHKFKLLFSGKTKLRPCQRQQLWRYRWGGGGRVGGGGGGDGASGGGGDIGGHGGDDGSGDEACDGRGDASGHGCGSGGGNDGDGGNGASGCGGDGSGGGGGDGSNNGGGDNNGDNGSDCGGGGGGGEKGYYPVCDAGAVLNGDSSDDYVYVPSRSTKLSPLSACGGKTPNPSQRCDKYSLQRRYHGIDAAPRHRHPQMSSNREDHSDLDIVRRKRTTQGESAFAVIRNVNCSCDICIQNVMNASRLFWNHQALEAIEFRNGMILHGFDLDVAIGEMDDYNRTISLKDEFLTKYSRKTINGFKLLRRCHRIVSLDDGLYYCPGCCTYVLDVTPRYKLRVQVSDGSESAIFLTFDVDCYTLLMKSCKELDPSSPIFPKDFGSLVGKQVLFKVEKKDRHSFKFNDLYTVKKVCIDTNIIDAFKQEIEQANVEVCVNGERSSVALTLFHCIETNDVFLAEDSDVDVVAVVGGKKSKNNSDNVVGDRNDAIKMKAMKKIKVEAE
ncbi:hypothetical protein E2542_SST00708 [Spatholobus suberectus]|nr:hypothetical protein E2542_SST00708 [Spatholobus suberectus]